MGRMKGGGAAPFGPALTVAVPDGRLRVWERGSGRPIVLVHGGTATAAHDWGATVDDLARDHHVVCFDHRGHGGSPDHGGDLALRRFAADLPHVLRRLGLVRATFVGFSMGANTVLHLLVRRPELADAAVVVGGSATGDPAHVRAIAADPAWPGSLRRLVHEVDPSTDYWHRLRSQLLEDWACHTELAPDALARVRCPVLVVNGADDPVQSVSVARHLAGSLPDARLEVVPGAGHAVAWDQPEHFLDLLRTYLAATAARQQGPS
jgi:3-oxoadipate enol-lactonase